MRVRYKSTGYKIAAVLRYYLLKLHYGKRLRIGATSMIGKRCGIYLREKGTMHCTGRIIVNDDVMLFSKGELRIGERFGINSYSRIVAHERIEIGSNVTVGQMVSILDHDHNTEMRNGNMELNGYTTAPISIGNNVWLGDKCTVLKGVTIGNNVVVGAHTLVNKNVPDNCVIAGTPFKIIQQH